MFKTIATTLAIASCLTIGEAAQADPTWKELKNEYPRSSHEKIVHRGGHKSLKKDLQRTVRYNEIPLRQLFGLNNRYAGFRVEAVSVKLKGHGNRGRARLMVNGRVTDSEKLRGRRLLNLRVAHNSVIGQDLRSLRLEVRGQAFIKSVKIHLRRAKFLHHRRWDRVWTLNRDHRSEPLPRYIPPIVDKLDDGPPQHDWTPPGYYLDGRLPKYTPTDIEKAGGGRLIGDALSHKNPARTKPVFEKPRNGHIAGWENRDTGTSYDMAPTQTHMAEDGSNCRDYTVWGLIGGFEQQIAGTACRKVDGSWQIGSN